MSVYESIMQGLTEAVDYQHGKIPVRKTKLTKRKPRFSSYLFWDIKKRGFDFDKHRLLMIERVCSRGLERDWQELLRYYGWETVKEAVVDIGWLDARTLSFLSCIFDMPKERFKCYKKRQSRKNYWDW